MSFDSLISISPIDGRYRKISDALADYFSEFALIKYRVLVEVEYFIALCDLELPQLRTYQKSNNDQLRQIYLNFQIKDAEQIKDFEKTTNHDVNSR